MLSCGGKVSVILFVASVGLVESMTGVAALAAVGEGVAVPYLSVAALSWCTVRRANTYPS